MIQRTPIAALLIQICPGCESGGNLPRDLGGETDSDVPMPDAAWDVSREDGPIAPNIGVWCDPADSDAGGTPNCSAGVCVP